METKALLYIDNFRGFSKTFIPIYEVNFLVGENSTGKTSILSLLKLLSEPTFWSKPDFNSEYVNLGSFHEIVSKGTYFKIGVARPNQMCLFKFKNVEGKPSISRFSFISGKNLVHLSWGTTSILYKTTTLTGHLETIEEIKRRLADSITEQDSTPRKYIKFSANSINSMTIKQVPLEVVTSFIIMELINTHKLQPLLFPTFPADLFPELTWLAPIRAKPKRTYDGHSKDFSPEGEHVPYLLDKLLNRSHPFKEQMLELKEFGQRSGLFEAIRVNHYGKESETPFEITLKISGKTLKNIHVGYGVSQILPVVVEMLIRPSHAWFAIQQPEIHLHPKAQAEFGELLFKLAKMTNEKGDRRCFLIETHSDFLIDRFRLNYTKDLESSPSSQILFFEKTPTGNRVHSLPINQKGQYPEDQPVGFRDFFIHEELKLLRL